MRNGMSTAGSQTFSQLSAPRARTGRKACRYSQMSSPEIDAAMRVTPDFVRPKAVGIP